MCIWWRPWCLQRRRAWPIHQGEEDAQQSGFPGKWWLIACCNVQGGKPQQQYVRKCHSRRSSWLTWPLKRYQCRGGPVSRPCRCRCCRIPSSCASSSYLPLQCSSEPCQPSWRPFRRFWAASWRRYQRVESMPAAFRVFLLYGWSPFATCAHRVFVGYDVFSSLPAMFYSYTLGAQHLVQRSRRVYKRMVGRGAAGLRFVLRNKALT